jgi:hypothetical protein
MMYLFHWRAVVEILFFSYCFYAGARWLRKDSRLLFGFYAYCFTLLAAQAAELTTIAHCLLVFAPVAAMLSLVFHQDMLAKNYVTVRNITPVKPTTDWLAVLYGSLLTAVQKNQPALVVIEKQDSLASLLVSSSMFHADIQKNLLDLLLASPLYEPSKLIWINHKGQLLALNAQWQATVDEEWVADDVAGLDVWKQDALLLAHKTDALILFINPQTRAVDLICQKKMIEGVTIAQAMLMSKQYLFGANEQLLDSLPQFQRARSTANRTHIQN